MFLTKLATAAWLLTIAVGVEHLPADAGQHEPPVVQASKTVSIEELIPELPKVDDLLAGRFLSNIKQPTTRVKGEGTVAFTGVDRTKLDQT